MKRIFSYTITAQDSDQRIYDFLCHHGYSRHIRTWLKQHPGSVRLNDKEALFYFPLKTGDLLEITLEEEQPSENIIPVCLPLHIIYEDEDLMVIDKPADMPVHPSIGNYENTLANAVAWYFQQQNIPFVFRCINRLDRDTTGLLILAKKYAEWCHSFRSDEKTRDSPYLSCHHRGKDRSRRYHQPSDRTRRSFSDLTAG